MCIAETPGLPEINENEQKLPVHGMFNHFIRKFDDVYFEGRLIVSN